MKEIARLSGVEWRETIGHTPGLNLPMYVNRPLPNQPVMYHLDKDQYIIYSKYHGHGKTHCA
jgi:hypothetical protein